MKYLVFFTKEHRFEIKHDFYKVDEGSYIKQFREEPERLVIECEGRTLEIPLNQFIIEYRQ